MHARAAMPSAAVLNRRTTGSSLSSARAPSTTQLRRSRARRRLQEVAGRLEDQPVVVMRVYFEKPRTTLGWSKG